MPGSEAIGKCFCGKEALQRCSGCQSVFYCSREHQKADWKKHRSNCRAYRVERTLNVGHRLIACRDLKAGDVILQEKPLVMGPKYTAGQVCLGCYSSVDGRTKCSQCGWPTCGRAECHTSDSDHAVECGLIASGGRPIVGSLPVQAFSFGFGEKVVRKMLQESSTIFSWEPEETDEGQLAVISAKELDTLMIF